MRWRVDTLQLSKESTFSRVVTIETISCRGVLEECLVEPSKREKNHHESFRILQRVHGGDRQLTFDPSAEGPRLN